jgi:hypothetical protein
VGILAMISAQANLWEHVMHRRSFLALAVLIAIPDAVRAQDRLVQAPSGQVRVETLARGLTPNMHALMSIIIAVTLLLILVLVVLGRERQSAG